VLPLDLGVIVLVQFGRERLRPDRGQVTGVEPSSTCLFDVFSPAAERTGLSIFILE
jgi:hypothetical protein